MTVNPGMHGEESSGAHGVGRHVITAELSSSPLLEENMYYNLNKTLSRQRLFNFVVGARGCGKTYGAKRAVISRFLRDGAQFVYLRRYETEMPAAEMRNFFDDISDEFPGVDFKSYNGIFRINNKIAGWYFPLSKAIMLKSIPFPNVGLIIFDEFIIEVGIYHYLPNEVRTFLECYSTISRDRDVPVLFLSNAITMTNPYFIYFNITFEKHQTVKLLKHISVELIQSEEYVNHVSQTKFGELIADTEYGSYHTQNTFLLDTPTFIKPLPVGASYISTFLIENRKIGFYVSTNDNLWFMSYKVDKSCTKQFALKLAEHNTSTVLAMRTNPYVQIVIDKFCQGTLRFESQEVKNICTDTLRRLI